MKSETIVRSGRQQPLKVLEQRVTVLVGAAETAGAYTVIEQ